MTAAISVPANLMVRHACLRLLAQETVEANIEWPPVPRAVRDLANPCHTAESLSAGWGEVLTAAEEERRAQTGDLDNGPYVIDGSGACLGRDEIMDLTDDALDAAVLALFGLPVGVAA